MAALRAVASAEPAAEEAPQEQEIPSSSSRLPPEEWQERQHEFLASTFETLERDKEHSFEVEGQLNQIFAPGNVAGTRMTSNLCASTMCKVTLAHDDESSQIAVGMAITGKPPFDGPAYFFYSKEGDTPVTTVYVGRRGEVLPISPELQEP